MKVLHLINDSLFTNFTMELFEECNPNGNTFLIGVRDVSAPLKFTRYGEGKKGVIVARIRSRDYYSVINSTIFDVLIIHCLHNFKSVDVVRSQKNKSRIVVWLAWGTDLNWIPNFSRSLFLPMTESIVNKIGRKSRKRGVDVFSSLYHLLKYGMTVESSYRKAAEIVDFCGTVMPQEYARIRECLPEFTAKYIDFSYASLEKSFAKLSLNRVVELGNGILVGNSSNPTSNHLDVFFALQQLGINDRNIHCVLNYGEYDSYTKQVVSEGKACFGDNFIPLLGKVLSESEYIQFLSGCNIAVFLHHRQQALGNIIILLWLGVKVFLSENSPVYTYFKERGAIIFSFEKELKAASVLQPLRLEEVWNNRKVIKEAYSHDVIIQKTKALLKHLGSIDKL